MKFNLIDKILLCYLVTFFIFLFLIIPSTSIAADEGTHSLLSIFYKDMITTVLSNWDFSFQKVYNFGISYLVHYPKLQVFYPPLYHIITGLVFYPLFGISIFTSRLVNVIMTVSAAIVLYFTTKKLFNQKTAIITVVLFSLFPVTLIIGREARMEFTVIFFVITSLYFYLESWKSGKYKFYILTSFMVFLAMMSKRTGFFLIPIYGLHIIFRGKWKELLVFLIPALIVSIPYFLILWKINGFDISSTIYSRYAFGSHTLNSWWFFLEFPFLLILIFIFFYHNYKTKGDKEKFFVLWFFIFFIGILLIQFKSRYFTYFLIPIFMVSGDYLLKIQKRWLCIFLIGYMILSLLLIVKDWKIYPQVEEVSNKIYSTIPEGGNVAMFSESHYRHSSAFTFHLARLDEDKELFFYRACTFHNKTREEISNFIEKNNVYYIIAIPGSRGYENVNKIGDKLRLVEDGPVELYEIRKFSPKQKEYCNYICLIEEKICTEYFSPYDVYRS